MCGRSFRFDRPTRIGHHLSRLSTQRYPDPRFIGLLQHKGPQFIQFQYRRICIIRIRRYQRFAQGWQLFCFFLSMRSLKLAILQMSALLRVNYFALHRLSLSLLFVLLDTHSESDFHGFASYMLYNSSSVFRWGHAHYVLILRFRNADNES